jgi:beta-mannosidase
VRQKPAIINRQVLQSAVDANMSMIRHWGGSDRTTPATGELRVRLVGVDGKTVNEKSQAIEVPPLSSHVSLRLPKEEFTKGADLSRAFVVADLIVGGKTVSSNLLFLVPTKEVRLPQAPIKTEWSGTRLRLSSTVLARSVWISFGDLDVTPSDNYFDLLPGQPVEIAITGAADAADLRKNLKVMSLVDAFAEAK